MFGRKKIKRTSVSSSAEPELDVLEEDFGDIDTEDNVEVSRGLGLGSALPSSDTPNAPDDSNPSYDTPRTPEDNGLSSVANSIIDEEELVPPASTSLSDLSSAQTVPSIDTESNRRTLDEGTVRTRAKRAERTPRKGHELIYLYHFIEEKIGVDALLEAKERRNNLGGGVHIFSTLQTLNMMDYKESAELTLEVFKEYFDDLKVVKFDDLSFSKGATFYDNTEVRVCLVPHYGESMPQVILSFADYSQYEGHKRSISNSAGEKEKEKERTEISYVSDAIGGKVYPFEEVVKDAKGQGASDIHVTYSSELYNVLFVIDGLSIVQKRYIMNHEQGLQFVSKIKIDAAPYSKGGFNPEISYKSQDATIKYPNLGVDTRIVFIPDGLLKHNSVTVRLLKKQAIERGDFDFVGKMGYGEKFAKLLARVKNQRNGLFVASGVTGSGKSTLTSHVIATIPSTERIYTIEDPIEYVIDGANVTQHQIYVPPPNPDGTKSEKAMGWKEYITSLKRAAPDVASIGELRNDPELSKMVVEMSEAGQLVFTTVHIKSAFGIYSVLEEVFGIKYNASAKLILFSTNQVLVRRLCPKCKIKDSDFQNKEKLEQLHQDNEVRYAYTKPLINFIKNASEHEDTYLKGNDESCAKCNGSGYVGRIPVYEYFKPDQEFIEYLIDGEPQPHDIEKQACQRGIGENKLQRYIQLIKEGVLDTSFDIIRKVI